MRPNKLIEKKGITLVALVVTVIVLIILAGVSIQLLLGENGIIKLSKDAQEKQDIARLLEKLELLKGPILIDKATVNLDTYLEELDKYTKEYKIDYVDKVNETNAYTVLEGKYRFLITDTEDGNVIIIYDGLASELLSIQVTATPYSGIYDGKAHGITVTCTPNDATIEYSSNGETYSSTNPTYTDVGTYTTYYKVSKAGYKTVEGSLTVVLSKATGDLALSATSGTITYPDANTTTFTVTKNVSGGALSVSSSNDNIATATISGNTVTVTVGTTSGKATITVTSASTSNYEEKTATYEITVIMNTVEELRGKDFVDEKTTIEDSDGNEVVIPEGFKIAEDSGDNVTEGIVIEDNDIKDGIGNNRGNQYVWIPVGEGIKKSDGTTVDIELGRYTFATDGTETLVQSAENYTEETIIQIGNYKYKELVTSRTGVASTGSSAKNTTALDLKGFIDSVSANGGYYIARYEASYGTDGKVNSKVSNSYSTTTAPKTEGALWNFITQINAATASRGLYTTVNSDLINSYAWDTAIVYIQKFSDDLDYSKQTSFNTSLINTGTIGDEVCKINDMASNCVEWNTEYSDANKDGNYYPCSHRGDWYDGNYGPASYRGSMSTTGGGRSSTFRTTLYI